MDLRKILFYSFFILILAGCVKDQVYQHENTFNRRTDADNGFPVNNINGSWVVYSFVDLENGSVVKKSNENSGGLDIELKFADSTFCGINTTNDVAGRYIIQDSTIRVEVYGGTKVGQPKWGNMFSDIVRSIESFKISNSQLRLYYNFHKNCVILYPTRKEIECRWIYTNK